ncbi:substrate-binding domain-containing protein [Micromonospora sp. CPCC 206060]|uniref:substrate-binding domain-containing protein n=1 Tax=Micromonospora sp. CPCC 206060 TaxID=3122406 RepID=UPI002FF2E194
MDRPLQQDLAVDTVRMMAVGVLRMLRDRQLIPGLDVEVVVFDDASWTGLLTPAISVIHQPAYELGQAAGKLLLERLRSLASQPER